MDPLQPTPPTDPDAPEPDRHASRRGAKHYAETVVHAIERITGSALPRPRLHEAAGGEAGTPTLEEDLDVAGFVPQGRCQYKVQGEIARGGLGVILKAHDGDLGRDVAMKVLREELTQRPEIVQRFVEEAQIGGQLQHPGIVPVYELGLMADQRPYFAMKLVRGRTLAAVLAERKEDVGERRKLLDVFAAICQTMA